MIDCFSGYLSFFLIRRVAWRAVGTDVREEEKELNEARKRRNVFLVCFLFIVNIVYYLLLAAPSLSCSQNLFLNDTSSPPFILARFSCCMKPKQKDLFAPGLV